MLNSKHLKHNFSKFDSHEVAGYLKSQLEAAGAEVEDKVGYVTADLGELINLREALVEKKGHKYLKKKETEQPEARAA